MYSKEGFTYFIEENSEGGSSFFLVDRVGRRVAFLLFYKAKGRTGELYRIPLLGTSNAGLKQLGEVGINVLDEIEERIPGLLYIVFQIFIEYLKTVNYEEFILNIENPLLTLKEVYQKLLYTLGNKGLMEKGAVTPRLVVIHC